MARGRRRAPVKPEVILPLEHSDDDDADGFVASRHNALAAADDDDASVGDDGADLGVGREAGVMDIDVSDSSDESDEDDEDEDGGDVDGDEDAQWGGRRRAWYGGDTHEYEIMEQEERDEALKEEEVEARRLQSKAMALLEPEDFVDSDGEDDGEDDEGMVGVVDENEDVGRDEGVLSSAPELPALVDDLRACLEELPRMRNAVGDREGLGAESLRRAKVRFHVLSNYATNLAFYLTLRTDPYSVVVDIKTHPVIAEILRFRDLKLRTDDYGVFEKKENARDVDAPAVVVEEENYEAPQVEVLPSMAEVMQTDGASGAELRGEGEIEEPVKKKKKRGKRKQKSVSEGGKDDADDEAFISSVVGKVALGSGAGESAGSVEDGAAKRRKLNRIVGALERERQSSASRRVAPMDMQLVRQEPARPKMLRRDFVGDGDVGGGGEGLEGDGEGSGDDDDSMFVDRMLAKKEKKDAKAAAKADAVVPHHYAFNDKIKDKTERRRASSQVVHNRGLTRYRPRERKTPRTKNREAFSKAVKKRKSVVRDPVAAKPSSYGGEASGINQGKIKSSRLSDV